MSESITQSSRDRMFSIIQAAPSTTVKMVESMAYGDERKYVTVDIPAEEHPTQIEISMLTDLQYGHIYCNVKKFIEYRDWILKSPHRFCVFGGDLIDAATKTSVGSPWDNNWNPSETVLRFVELVMPLRPRILGYVGGNHERRTDQGFGSLEQIVANLMGIPYSAGKQIVDIKYGKHDPYQIALWHGGGAARTKGARAQMLHRFMQEGGSHTDLYLCGHLHDVIVLYDWKQIREHGNIRLKKVCGAMSSSFLDYFGTYAEVIGLPPSSTMMARCILEPNGKWEITLR